MPFSSPIVLLVNNFSSIFSLICFTTSGEPSSSLPLYPSSTPPSWVRGLSPFCPYSCCTYFYASLWHPILYCYLLTYHICPLKALCHIHSKVPGTERSKWMFNWSSLHNFTETENNITYNFHIRNPLSKQSLENLKYN